MTSLSAIAYDTRPIEHRVNITCHFYYAEGGREVYAHTDEYALVQDIGYNEGAKKVRFVTQNDATVSSICALWREGGRREGGKWGGKTVPFLGLLSFDIRKCTTTKKKVRLHPIPSINRSKKTLLLTHASAVNSTPVSLTERAKGNPILHTG